GRTAETIDEAEALVGGLTRDHARSVATAALDTLLARSEVDGVAAGTIGFSLGGAWVLLLSVWRPEQVAAVVDFYGTIEGDYAAAQAAYLGHFAPADEWEPDESVHALEAALRDAGHEVTFHSYPGAGHWFFEDNRPDAYNADAAQLAWERTLSFLRNHLA
ncbi:MAG: dienelactone hydrolase family protein, partial [Chloroflexota bacterium]|nr:dienelactone hydrolase family protein [Chloroflexota bacterium]